MGRTLLSFLFLLFGVSQPFAHADVNSSKVNAYTVVSPPNGAIVSKATAYTIVAPPDGMVVTKAVLWLVHRLPQRLNQVFLS